MSLMPFIYVLHPPLAAYTTASQSISDAAIDKLVNASFGTLGFIIVIIVLVTLGPVLYYLARRDAKRDALAERLIEQADLTRKDNLAQAANDREDNRRLLAIVEQGQADNHQLIESMTILADRVGKLEITDTQRLATGKVVADEVLKVRAAITDLPSTIQHHRDTQTQELTLTMNTGFSQLMQEIRAVREMVEALKGQSNIDHQTLVAQVDHVLERLDAIQSEKLPDTGGLEGKVATGPDAARTAPPTPALPAESPTPEKKEAPT